MLIHRTQRLDVQLAASREHPHGRVVSLYPGWNDVDEKDEEFLGHPIVSRLLPGSPAVAKRLVAHHKAEIARDDAVAKAHADYAAAMRDIQAANAKDLASDVAAWQKRRDKALADGDAFDEPHPDPEQASAYARTAGPPAPTPTATIRMEKVPDDAQPSRVVVPPKKLTEKPKPETKETKPDAGSSTISGTVTGNVTGTVTGGESQAAEDAKD